MSDWEWDPTFLLSFASATNNDAVFAFEYFIAWRENNWDATVYVDDDSMQDILREALTRSLGSNGNHLECADDFIDLENSIWQLEAIQDFNDQYNEARKLLLDGTDESKSSLRTTLVCVAIERIRKLHESEKTKPEYKDEEEVYESRADGKTDAKVKRLKADNDILTKKTRDLQEQLDTAVSINKKFISDAHDADKRAKQTEDIIVYTANKVRDLMLEIAKNSESGGEWERRRYGLVEATLRKYKWDEKMAPIAGYMVDANLYSVLTKDREARIKDLVSANESAQKRIEQLIKENNDLKLQSGSSDEQKRVLDTIKTLEQARDVDRRTVADLRIAYDDLKSESDIRTSSLQAKLNEEKARLVALQAQFDSASRRIRNLQDEASAGDRESEARRERELQDSVIQKMQARYESENSQIQQRAERAETQLRQTQSESNKFREDLRRLDYKCKMDKAASDAKIKKLEQSNADARTQANALIDANKKLNDDLAARASEIIKRDLVELQETITEPQQPVVRVSVPKSALLRRVRAKHRR
jgi:hypothetical protein